ncbi:MAG TPA: methyltransferase domain-containing protein [Actinomycetota bacterium]|nr:methyltransferase domain-containing protein [Actinomycetota bacterium]
MTLDLMQKSEIQQLVADAYRALEETPGGPAARFYADDQLTALPDGAVEWALGVGNPVASAELAPGEVVADLGCGSGIDTLLAAGLVGPTGKVIGIDFLAEMAERARSFAAKAAAGNVEIHQAEMESLPLPNSSVDVVISNGSINLSARKSRVLAEAHRVLRPGGRLCVSDLTICEEDLPAEILTHPSAWAG